MAPRIAGAAAMAVITAVLLAASSGADGRDFYVGGRGGWAPNPGEPFNTWAERNRFQVNDTLVFRYNKDIDGVLVVSQSHYDACNATQPLLRLAGGDSRFVFDNSGPYFFISADAERCRAGERLIVVVLAVRNSGGGSTPSSSPSLSPPPPPPPKASSSPAPVATPAPRALAPPPKSSSSSPSLSPPPPPPPKASSSPAPVATPAPRALAPPPKSSSSSPTTSPPPVATPSPPASSSPPPASGKNDSSPAPAPVPAPAPAPGTNGTSSPPPPSSAAALRGGGVVLACLIIGASAVLV